MAKCVGIGLRLPHSHRLSHLVGAYLCSYSITSAVGSVLPINLSKAVSNIGRAPRRLVLGVGASLWAQLMSMSGAIGGKAFTASARLKSGPSFEEILKNVDWPEQIPYKPEDFQRYDESPDTLFYESPRFVTHIDDPAIAALKKYYSKVFLPRDTPGVSMLDMCSSWDTSKSE